MTQERQNLVDAVRDPAWRQARPVYKDHRNAKVTRCVKLGARAGATRVLGNDQVDAMVLQKHAVTRLVKRAARDNGRSIGQGKRAFGRIDKAKQVVMLRLRGKVPQVLLADGQEDANGYVRQGHYGGRDIRHMGPAIPSAGNPWRAFVSTIGDARTSAGGNRVAAHLRGEGVGRIDDMGYAFILEIAAKPLGPAKAADPCRQRLGDRRIGAAGVGKNRVDPQRRKAAGKLAGFGRSAQKKDARHV